MSFHGMMTTTDFDTHMSHILNLQPTHDPWVYHGVQRRYGSIEVSVQALMLKILQREITYKDFAQSLQTLNRRE